MYEPLIAKARVPGVERPKVEECGFEREGHLQCAIDCDLEDGKASISILDSWSVILLSCPWLVEREGEQLKDLVSDREAIADRADGGVYGIYRRPAWVRILRDRK